MPRETLATVEGYREEKAQTDEEGALTLSFVDPAERAHGRFARRSRASRLSDRERLVLAELARGLSTEEIAVELFLSPHTVRTHIKNALRRLGARTRAHGVAIALSEGAIEL
ncbi:MAG: hypothetical protein NVSMB25_17660 [Thermoleophilaceae bacterium]